MGNRKAMIYLDENGEQLSGKEESQMGSAV